RGGSLMPSLLRHPGSAGARPCQGRSSLDRACAPAEYGSYREARTDTISQVKVSTLSGEPRPEVGVMTRYGTAARTGPIRQAPRDQAAGVGRQWLRLGYQSRLRSDSSATNIAIR